VDGGGQPLERVRVKLSLPERGGGGPTAVTDKKGRWAVAGIVAGPGRWTTRRDGFATFKGRFKLPSEQAAPRPVRGEAREERRGGRRFP
jgi:hypothetical protein